MKKFTRTFALAITLALGTIGLSAQQWSDVGNQGFTPTPTTGTLNDVTYTDFEVFGTTPYVAYHLSTGGIAVMKYASGTWTSLPSPGTGSVQRIDLNVDNAGTPYLCYASGTSIQVKKFDGANWVAVGTGSVNSAVGITNATRSRIVFDQSNVPHVGMSGSTGMTVAKYNGTTWVAVGVQAFTGSSGFFRMKMTSNGNIYFAGQLGVTTDIHVWKFDGTSWTQVGTSPGGFLFPYTDIAIDGSGVPYVLINGTLPGFSIIKALVYKFDGTSWVAVGGAANPGEARYATLAINSANVVHVASSNGSANQRANLFKFDGTNWVVVGVANFSSGISHYPIVNFDTNNVPYVGFSDGSYGQAATVMKFCSTSSSTISSSTPGNACGSGAVTLTATGTGALKWYGELGNQVGTGTSYTTPNLSVAGVYPYFVSSYDGNGCSSARTSVNASIILLPSITATQPGGACSGSPAQIGATANLGSVSWYTTLTGGSPFATGIVSGSLVTTPVVTSTTNFYAEAVNNGCPSAVRTSVQAIAHAIPPNPVAVPNNRCGPGTVSISVTADPGTVQWFSALSGGTLLQASGSTFATPSISSTTSYYANVTSLNGCPSPSRTAVSAAVITIPTITSSTPADRCGEGSVNLVVTTSGDASARWFTEPTGGTQLGTAKTLVTPVIGNTTNFYAEAWESGCPSLSRTAVVATIKPFPAIAATDVSRCDAGTVTFEAGSIGAISWFDVLSGGSVLGTGANFTTPSISTSTPYFIEAALNGCSTPVRTQVMAIVNPTPPQPTITQNNSTIEGPVLTSSGATGNQWFKDDVMIGSAIANTYTIADEGNYKVQVTLNGCISRFSNAVTYVITGFETPTKELLKLFPNPTADVLVVSLKGFDHNRLVSVAVMDFLGRLITENIALGGEELHFNVGNYQNGQYIVLARQGIRKVTKTFIKSR
jgi:hypothetical protein